MILTRKELPLSQRGVNFESAELSDARQRAMVAAKLANLAHGGDRSKAPIGALKDADAASMLNVGERSVERAKTVQRDGTPELQHAVEQGAVSVSAAAEFANIGVDLDRRSPDRSAPSSGTRKYSSR